MFTALFFALLLQDPPASPYESFENLRRESIKAYRAADYPVLLEKTRQAHDLVPDHVRNHFNMALALTFNKRYADALDVFAELAAMGLVFDIETDEMMKPLAELPRFKEVIAQFKKNQEPTGSSTVAFTLDQRDLFPEGIVYDAKTKRYLIGSIHQRKIVAYSPDGLSDLVPSGTDGIWSVLGINLNQSARELWVTTTALPQTKDLAEADRGQTAVYRFDADTGKMQARYQVEGHKGNLGDLTRDKSGNLYLSDGTGGAVYHLDRATNKLSQWVTSPMFKSPQGLCLSADESRLYMADWTRGLFVIDTKTRGVTKLKQPINASLIGIDGMVRYKNSLIAIQNGITPHRVVRIDLSAAGDSVKKVSVLEMNNPHFDEPTLGTLVKNQFIYIGTSQWGRYDREGTPLANDKLIDIKILALDL